MGITSNCGGMQCEYRIHPATRTEPAEFCDQDAMPHSEFCEDHGGEAAFEAYLAEWEEWTDGPEYFTHIDDAVCECVKKHDEDWQKHYIEYHTRKAA